MAVNKRHAEAEQAQAITFVHVSIDPMPEFIYPENSWTVH